MQNLLDTKYHFVYFYCSNLDIIATKNHHFWSTDEIRRRPDEYSRSCFRGPQRCLREILRGLQSQYLPARTLTVIYISNMICKCSHRMSITKGINVLYDHIFFLGIQAIAALPGWGTRQEAVGNKRTPSPAAATRTHDLNPVSEMILFLFFSFMRLDSYLLSCDRYDRK